jgi:alkyl hydroperoxide reductase subunit AhpF
VHCEDVRSVLEELDALSSRIALTVHDIEQEHKAALELGVDKAPGIVLRGPANRPVRFFGFPSGTIFPTFVDSIIDVSQTAPGLQPDTVKQLRKLKTDLKLQVLVTTTCPYSPTEMRTAIRFGLQTVRLKVDVIEIAEYPEIGRRLGIRAAPTTLIGEELMLPGLMDETVLALNVLRVAEGRPVTAEMKTGVATPIDPAVFQPQQQRQQPALRQSPGGIILPG